MSWLSASGEEDETSLVFTAWQSSSESKVSELEIGESAECGVFDVKVIGDDESCDQVRDGDLSIADETRH